MFVDLKMTIITACASALLLMGAGLYIWRLKSVVADQQATVTSLTSANKTLERNNATLSGALARTNAALDKIAEEADVTNQKFAALDGKIASQTTVVTKKLVDIMNAPKPATCEAAIKYLAAAVKESAK
jgi:hypothetical protein